jgi:uncharacterized protein with FMN-binding domain
MKRNVTWLLSTITIMVLLFGYRTSTSGALPVSTIQSATPLPSSATSGSTSGSSTSTSDSSSSPPDGSGSTTGTSSTVAGNLIQTRWGPVQVQLTVADGGITAVDMLAYPSENPKDIEINSRALPILIQETLDAQNAQIDMVSGATITSEGYLQSLQSALDQAQL